MLLLYYDVFSCAYVLFKLNGRQIVIILIYNITYVLTIFKTQFDKSSSILYMNLTAYKIKIIL